MQVGFRNAITGGKKKPAYWGLCFTAEEAGTTITMNRYRIAPVLTLQTSTDGVTWTPFVVDETTITLSNVGDKVYFAAGEGGNAGTAAETMNPRNPSYNAFSISGKAAASGDLRSLLDNSVPVTEFQQPCVFGCLFLGCTGLTSAPQLPATTLASSCYYSMFQGCTGLTAAPELPATTLTSYCYSGMFYNCPSLIDAPELPATTLTEHCYYRMFNGCTSLTDITVNFTSWGDGAYETSTWVGDVASSGTFRCPTALGTNETITRGTSNCPSGWTVVNTD